MKAEERDRHELHTGLKELLGADRAATLMTHLSPVAWPDVATKNDTNDLRAAINDLRVATKKDLTDLEAATKKDLDHLGEKLRLEIQSSADRVRADLLHQMNLQTRTMIFALLAAIFTVAGVVGSLAFSIR